MFDANRNVCFCRKLSADRYVDLEIDLRFETVLAYDADVNTKTSADKYVTEDNIDLR